MWCFEKNLKFEDYKPEKGHDKMNVTESFSKL